MFSNITIVKARPRNNGRRLKRESIAYTEVKVMDLGSNEHRSGIYVLTEGRLPHKAKAKIYNRNRLKGETLWKNL